MPDPITPTLPDPQASVDAALGSVPMGDETPLAFAAPTLNTMPAAPAAPTTPVVPEAPKTTAEPEMPAAPVAPVVPPMPKPEAPKLEPMPNIGSSYLPPVPPAPISTPPVEEKPKKNKVKNLIMGLVAFLTLAGTGGYVAFNMYGTGSIPNISIVSKQPRNITDPGDCSGESNGGWLVWRNGECKVTGISGSEVPGKNTEPPPNTAKPNEKAGSPDNCGDGYSWCGGGISKCVSFEALAANGGGGCNKYGEVVYGIATVYGANPGKTSCDPTKVAAGLQTECPAGTCGTGSPTYCFDRNGSCNSTPILRNDGSTVDTGFCGIVGTTKSGVFTEKPGLFCSQADVDAGTNGCKSTNDLKYKFNCDMNGCSTTDSSCKILHYTCNGTKTGNSCTDNPENPAGTSSSSFKKACGKVEQIDVMCGGYVESRTSINPPCEEATVADTPSTHKACNTTTKVCETVTGAGADTCTTDANCVTAAPVLACTGLTSAPATPVVGQTVTFTCAGTITPTGAATLSYKFRYSLDGGADQLLPNKTATTAELAISACGTYSVQCKVCATIAGVLKCDPTWQGAVQ